MKGSDPRRGRGHPAAADHPHQRQAAGAGGQQADPVLRPRGHGRRRASPRSASSSATPPTRSGPRSATARGGASTVTYIPQDAPLGLAHCVLIAREFLGDDDFVMYLGDNLLEQGVTPVRRRLRGDGGAGAQILLCRVPDPQRFGVAELDGRRRASCGWSRSRHEPPSDLALVGVYLFDARDPRGGARHRAVGARRARDHRRHPVADRPAATACSTPDARGLVDRHRQARRRCSRRNRLVLETLEPRIDGKVDDASRIEGRVVVETGAEVVRLDDPRARPSSARAPAIVDSFVGPFTVDRRRLRDHPLRDRALGRARAAAASSTLAPHRGLADRQAGRGRPLGRSGRRRTGSCSATTPRSTWPERARYRGRHERCSSPAAPASSARTSCATGSSAIPTTRSSPTTCSPTPATARTWPTSRAGIAFVQGDIGDLELAEAALREHAHRRGRELRGRVAQQPGDRSTPAASSAPTCSAPRRCCEAARRVGVERFHHISTCEVYGDLDLDADEAFTEESPYRPRTPYNASKAAADHAVRAYHETFGLPVTITNCANNYGPVPVPREGHPAVHDQRPRRPAAAAVRVDAEPAGVDPRPRPLPRHRPVLERGRGRRDVPRRHRRRAEHRGDRRRRARRARASRSR